MIFTTSSVVTLPPPRKYGPAPASPGLADHRRHPAFRATATTDDDEHQRGQQRDHRRRRNRSSSRRSSWWAGRHPGHDGAGWPELPSTVGAGSCRYSTPRPLARIPAWPPRARPRRSAPPADPHSNLVADGDHLRGLRGRAVDPDVSGAACHPGGRTCLGKTDRPDPGVDSSGHAVSGPRGDGC